MIRPRRSAITQILRRAADRGELPSDLDIGLLLDVYAGAVFYRVLVSGEPVTNLLAEQLVSLLLDGKAPKPSSVLGGARGLTPGQQPAGGIPRTVEPRVVRWSRATCWHGGIRS